MSSSIKKDFRQAFFKIIFLSFICSLITFFVWSYSFSHYMYPANYYELQIPEVLDKLRLEDEVIFDKSYKKLVDSIIPDPGLSYQVIDLEGNYIYGDFDERVVKDKQDLLNSVNSTLSRSRNTFYNLNPIFDKNKNIKGAFLIKYSLNPSFKKDNSLGNYLFKYSIFLPLIYVIIFTLIFSRILSKKFNRPIRLLTEATENIKNKNLDFSIDYGENNEFSKLICAFESMKLELKKSLTRQWTLEEKRRENIKAIGHDLKTPLTIIKISAESLANTDLSDEKSAYVDIIARNNDRALKLLANMRELSNIEDPNFSLAPSLANIAQVIDLKIKDFILVCASKGIIFSYDIEDRRIKKSGLFDWLALEQVFNNIVSNAIRFSKLGDAIILEGELKEDFCCFTITNTGSSFSSEDLTKLFQKFYKGDPSRSFASGQSGLGLYISKSLVEKHGGNIKAYNKENGACVEFKIKNLE